MSLVVLAEEFKTGIGFETRPLQQNTAVLDIPEGCVLVGPQNARFFIFSDRLLAILHAMYLVSNKVALN